MPKMSRRPTSAQEFIEGAEAKDLAIEEKPKKAKDDVSTQKKPTPEKSLPWEDPRVRGDVLKVFNLRIPEPYLLKLKFISERTPHSMQSFVTKWLFGAIDRKVKSLLENEAKD